MYQNIELCIQVLVIRQKKQGLKSSRLQANTFPFTEWAMSEPDSTVKNIRRSNLSCFNQVTIVKFHELVLKYKDNSNYLSFIA